MSNQLARLLEETYGNEPMLKMLLFSMEALTDEDKLKIIHIAGEAITRYANSLNDKEEVL